MTIDEAKIYFVTTDKEELESEYQTELFKQKNFFVTTSPIPKVFLARLKKLKRIHEAYLTLGGEDFPSDYLETRIALDDDLGSSFRVYNKVRNVVRQKIMITKSVSDLERMVLDLLEETRLYAKVWSDQYDNLEGVLVSNEMDQMNVLQELKRLEYSGIVTIEELKKLDKENILVRESKRLSLWLKLDTNV